MAAAGIQAKKFQAGARSEPLTVLWPSKAETPYYPVGPGFFR
jgi:hypothetical protein